MIRSNNHVYFSNILSISIVDGPNTTILNCDFRMKNNLSLNFDVTGRLCFIWLLSNLLYENTCILIICSIDFTLGYRDWVWRLEPVRAPILPCVGLHRTRKLSLGWPMYNGPRWCLQLQANWTTLFGRDNRKAKHI